MYKIIVYQSDGLAIYQHKTAKDACTSFHAADSHPVIVIHNDKMIATHNVLGVGNHAPTNWEDTTTLRGTTSKQIPLEEQKRLVEHFRQILKINKVRGLTKRASEWEYAYVNDIQQALGLDSGQMPPAWMICRMSGRSLLTLY